MNTFQGYTLYSLTAKCHLLALWFIANAYLGLTYYCKVYPVYRPIVYSLKAYSWCINFLSYFTYNVNACLCPSKNLSKYVTSLRIFDKA